MRIPRGAAAQNCSQSIIMQGLGFQLSPALRSCVETTNFSMHSVTSVIYAAFAAALAAARAALASAATRAALASAAPGKGPR